MKKIDFGFDPGYGYGKGAYEIGGEIKYSKENSVLGWSADPINGAIKFDGKYWFVGKRAFLMKNQVEITNHDGLEYHAPIMLLHMLNKAEIDPNEVGRIATGLSLAHASRANSFRARLSKFTANDREYEFDIRLIPQAEGAKYAIDLSGDEDSNYAVFDIGSNTLDAIVVIDNEIQDNSRYGQDNRGVFQVAKLLQQKIVKEGIGSVTLPEAMKALETGEVKLYGETHDVSGMVDEIKLDYTQELLTFIKKNWDTELRVLDKIVFVGGGSYFLDKDSLLPHCEIKEYAEYYNAVGNLKSLG